MKKKKTKLQIITKLKQKANENENHFLHGRALPLP